MTTAARPTWAPAKGGNEQGEKMGKTLKRNCRRGISVMSWRSGNGGISRRRISPILGQGEMLKIASFRTV
ncbi:hypothetical protein CsSME_00018055 [Camellia sinensis var. sinensis]